MNRFRNVVSQFRNLLPPLLAVGLALAGAPAVRPATTPSFESRTIETNAVLWWARAYGDVSGNGLIDILLQDNNGHGGVLRWYETRDQGTSWIMHVIAETAPNGSPFAAGDLAAADINNDGSLDVLGLAHPGEWKQAGAPTEIYWFQSPLPKGDPARDAWTAHHIGRAPAFVKDLRLADFNGNGRVDLVLITYEGNRFLVFRQDSPTQWTKAQDFEIPNLHEGLDVGDITGNGRPDVAVNGYWVENPGGNLTGEWIVRSIDDKWHNQTGDWSRNATKVFCHDITGDGRVEVFLSHSERADYPVSWYHAEDPRAGPWVEHVLTDKLIAVHTLQVWDFNSNGHYDVLAGVNAGRARALGAKEFPVTLFLNEGNNRQWREHVLSTEGIYNGQVADLTGNGAPDIFRLASHDAQQFEVWVNQSESPQAASATPPFHYIELDDQRGKWGDFDSPDWLRYFGLDAGDFDGDRFPDLVSGRYVYRNPGGDLSAPWRRTDLGANVDGMLALDVTGNGRADVIATALPNVYWCKAEDDSLAKWQRILIGTIPKTGHVNGQGYAKADLTGDGILEILLAAADGIYAARIPSDPTETPWTWLRIVARGTDEGFAVADMNGDGHLDVIGGDGPPGDENPTLVAWWNNPGTWTGDWQRHEIGRTIHAVDRVVAADFNGDGRMDVAVSEERWPGKEPDAHLWWFEANPPEAETSFTRHLLVRQFSMNNLDAGDLDGDGHMDLVTCEHKGPYLRLQWWRNDGSGNFVLHEIDRGKESHLGARLLDLDGDGALDIVSHAWDNHQYLHLWRNDRLRASAHARPSLRFEQVVVDAKPPANPWTKLVGDFNNDGRLDIAIAGSQGPLVWYANPTWTKTEVARSGWQTVGGAVADMDGDGYLDVIPGAQVWFENPLPGGDPSKDPWPAHRISTIRSHDALVADLDGDGRPDIVARDQSGFNHQTGDKIHFFRQAGPDQWEHHALECPHGEGLALADMDGDGDLDVVIGGWWFENPGRFATNWPRHPFTTRWTWGDAKVAVGDLNADGRPDIVLAPAEYQGQTYRLAWYAAPRDPRQAEWAEHVVVPQIEAVVHGLQVADMDGDGQPDIVAAQMHQGAAPKEVAVFINQHHGASWTKHVVATTGSHDIQVADFDGDGRPDILGANHGGLHQAVELWLNRTPQAVGAARGGPQPGDVFREYLWAHATGDAGGSLRVGGRLDYGGGPIVLPHELDLEYATRAEFVVEKLLCHEGTRGLSISVNSNAWITIPEAPGIPRPQWEYMHHTYPIVAVPLSQLQSGGANQVRLRVSEEHPWNWPQNLIYGVHLRLYYDAAKKPHPTGRLRSPQPGAVLGAQVDLQAEVSSSHSPIRQVDFLGRYEDVNLQGDGEYTQWQYHFHRAVLTNHIGSASAAPWGVTWDTAWVPDQPQPFRLAARVTDDTGLTYFTEAADGLTFQRRGLSVELCKPYDVPKRWLTRQGEHEQKFRVGGDLSQAVAAHLVWVSWSPGYMEGLYLNDRKLIEREGPRYGYYIHSVPVPDLAILKPGENVLRTGKTPLYDGTMVHGMELNWPGIIVLIQYQNQ